MSDPGRTVQWADGSWHYPAGGQHKETDPTILELTRDARLPQTQAEDQDLIEERLRLTVDTAAKMMRAAHHGQRSLSTAVLFPCVKDGVAVPPEPISWKDGASVQILKRLAAQVQKLEDCALDEGESELDRQVKIAQILTMMTKQQAAMETAIAKAVGMSSKASQQAAELTFKMRAHQDKMRRLDDGNINAVTIEGIADS